MLPRGFAPVYHENWRSDMGADVLIVVNANKQDLEKELEKYLSQGYEIKDYSSCVKLSGDMIFSVLITRDASLL